MIFDNRDIIVKLNKRRYIALIMYIVLIALLLIPDIFEEIILGYKKSIYIIIFTCIYITYVIFAYLKDYNFFSYNDESDKLIFRFISLRPFDNKKQAIEIHKKDFKGYKIKKSFFNLNENLILAIKTKKGIASFPPICISALSLKHKNMLLRSLKQFK